VIGIFSDTHGDIDLFDNAVDLLQERGAKRFYFLGGDFADLDTWVKFRRELVRGEGGYSDQDFVSDIGSFLKMQGVPVAPNEEGDALARIREPFLRVPDDESAEYSNGSMSKLAIDMLGDVLCCLVHDRDDLSKDDLENALVFCHGKEDEPKVVQAGQRTFVTPGRLSNTKTPTCGLLELVEKNLRFSAFSLDGKPVIDRHVIAIDRRTRLSVKG
jgi:hypothetical protein